MNKQIIIGFATEGATDERFLESVIQRSFEAVAFECSGQIEVLPVQYIKKQSGEFVEVVKGYARQAAERGVMVLCVHCDADDSTDASVFNHKINPAFAVVCNSEADHLCKILVAIVPVQMTEAWMLADKELLKSEIGTDKSDVELGIDRFPEAYGNPKECIENAVVTARQALPRRRRRDLTIDELYSPIGRKISLNRLKNLPSYLKFQDAVREAFRKLNYLH